MEGCTLKHSSSVRHWLNGWLLVGFGALTAALSGDEEKGLETSDCPQRGAVAGNQMGSLPGALSGEVSTVTLEHRLRENPSSTPPAITEPNMPPRMRKPVRSL